MYPNDGFRELGREECLRLLVTAPIGRIVRTRQALPALLPVHFALDGDGAVLLRTAAASEPAGPSMVPWWPSRLTRSTRSTPARTSAGVSSSPVTPPSSRTGPHTHGRPAQARLSWVPVPREVFVRIEPELVTERALVGGRGMYGVPFAP